MFLLNKNNVFCARQKKNKLVYFVVYTRFITFVGKFRMMKKLLTLSIMAIAITSMAVTEPKAPKGVTKRDTLRVDTIPLDSITIVDQYSPAPQM